MTAPPITVDPATLTGAYVREVRERHKLSRQRFSELCGFPGKSDARVLNIERKDSWKAGNREAVARVIAQLENGALAFATDSPYAVPDEVHLLADDEPVDGFAWTVGEPLAEAAALPVALRPPARLPALPPDAYRVSNGQLTTFQRCRRKWWLAWFRQLSPRQQDGVGLRDIGNRVHRALAMWYVPDGEPRTNPRDALERVITEDWTALATAAREAVSDVDVETRLAELAVRFNEASTLERAMVEGYVQWLEETGADEGLRVLGAEVPLAVELPLPTAVEVDGLLLRQAQLVALVDARVQRELDGARLFLDHKTVGSLTDPVATLPLNRQMLHYHLVEWLRSEEGEARCDGALYNMLRRVKRTGQAKPPFFSRVEVRHNVHELESYRTQLLAVTREMLQAERALRAGASHHQVAYATPGRDCKWACDFFSVCQLFDDGSRAEDMLGALFTTADPWTRYDRLDGNHDD